MGGIINKVTLKIETTNNNESCYFGNKTTSWGASLDVDDRDGYGPEHITGEAIDSGTYKLIVKYYDSGSYEGDTTVRVMFETSQDIIMGEKYHFRNAGDVWEVADISFPSGEITVLDNFIPASQSLNQSLNIQSLNKNKIKY
ncbi:MAG: hypothetical protein ACOCRO_08075 [Halanaerobiales bacterium]